MQKIKKRLFGISLFKNRIIVLILVTSSIFFVSSTTTQAFSTNTSQNKFLVINGLSFSSPPPSSIVHFLVKPTRPVTVPIDTSVFIPPLPTATPLPTAIPTPAIDPNSDAIWDKIAYCESDGNWGADTGNSYFGGLQFSQGAWDSVGGSGSPAHASRDEQIAKAKLLQSRRGWGVWGACAKWLGLQ